MKLDPEDRVPPAYRETLDERDRQRLEAARESGETYLPTFQGASTAPEEAAAAGAPRAPKPVYEAWRRPERAADPGREARGAGDRRTEGLVGVLIEAWTRPPEIVRVRWPAAAARDPGPASPGGMSSEAAGAVARTAESSLLPEGLRPEGLRPEGLRPEGLRPEGLRPEGLRPEGLPRIAAGTGLYARTMYAVDSDYPGPVLLEILEPPLAGAVASGAFTLVGERLVLRLNRLEYRGRSYAVDAWAAGLDCACYGVEGEVDSHWLERVLLPAAVRFAEGFLSALSRPSETVVIGDDVRYERRGSATRDAVHAGLATAARTAGDVLLENAPDGPTVRIARDTELVVVFAAPPEPGAARGAGDG